METIQKTAQPAPIGPMRRTARPGMVSADEFVNYKLRTGAALSYLDGFGKSLVTMFSALRGYLPRKQTRFVNGRYKKVNVYHSKKDRVILELAWQQQEHLNKTIDIIHQHQD